jgi:multidrug resistance protein, MATE family
MDGALRTLLLLAWPIVLARTSQTVIGFTDALLVAPLGNAALAGVTTAALNSYIAIVLPVGTVYIVQSFTAQLRGRGDLAAVHRYAWYGLGVAVAAEVVALALLPLIPYALAEASYDPEVREHIATYMSIRLLSVGPAVAIEALGNWYGGLGNTRPAMRAGVTAMLVNVLACYALIEPRFGLPGYGVAGAAWASVIGTLAGLAVIAVPFALGREAPPRPARLSLRASELVRVLRFGLPNGANWFLEFASYVVFLNVMVSHLGTSVLATFNVVIHLNSVAFMPAFGLASGGAILVGEAIGRRSFAEARRFTALTLATAAVWMASMGVLYVALPGPLMQLFTPPDQDVLAFLALGAVMLRYSALWQIFDATAIVLSEALRAAGDTTWCMYVRIVIAWFVFVPGAWLFVVRWNGGVTAVMLVMVAFIVGLALAFAARFLSGRWQEIDLIGEPEPLA